MYKRVEFDSEEFNALIEEGWSIVAPFVRSVEGCISTKFIMAPPPAFEYKEISARNGLPELNKLASEGWRCVSCLVPTGGLGGGYSNYGVFLLERLIQSG